LAEDRGAYSDLLLDVVRLTNVLTYLLTYLLTLSGVRIRFEFYHSLDTVKPSYDKNNPTFMRHLFPV